MSKSKKPIENDENDRDEEVVTSDVTEIYNREWEEEPEEQDQIQIEEQIDAVSDQTTEPLEEEPEQDNANQESAEPTIDYQSIESNIYKNLVPSPQPTTTTTESNQQRVVDNTYSDIRVPAQTANIPNSKLKMIALIVLIFVLIAGGGAAFAIINGKKSTKQPQGAVSVTPTPTISPADKAIDSFIAAILNKNKINADLMQTVAMQQTVKENGDTTSFYDYCQKSGYFCDQLFSKDYLGSGDVKTLDYTAKDGTKGKQRVYTITKTVSTPSSETSSKSVTIITFATIKVGDVWMIDYFNNESNFGVNTNL